MSLKIVRCGPQCSEKLEISKRDRKSRKIEVLRMKFSILENVPTPRERVFKLCTASQRPYKCQIQKHTRKHKKKMMCNINCPISPVRSYSLLARSEALLEGAPIGSPDIQPVLDHAFYAEMPASLDLWSGKVIVSIGVIVPSGHNLHNYGNGFLYIRS